MRNNKSIQLLAGACVSLLLLLTSLNVKAQRLTAQVSKNKIATGEIFELAFSINSNCSSFRPPNLSDFDVYSGPNQSTSMQFNNGSLSQSITLSYQMAAKKEGRYTIGPASVMVGGKKLESNSINIEVSKGNPNSANNRGHAAREEENATVSSDDLFIRSVLSKSTCYLGEQITLTQKVYCRLNVRGVQAAKPPQYNGFWSQDESKGSRSASWTVENIDGINYNVAVYSTTYLFPQRTGKLTIEPMEMDLVVRQQSNRRSNDIFEQFFGGGYQDVVVKLKSKAVNVEVMPLPEANKPAGFSGAVGSFNFKAELNKSEVKINEAINLKISIQGNGNIKLIEPRTIEFPEGFETYEPKVSENVSTNGMVNGSKTYDYLIIPRQGGEFIIKDLDFSYFDPSKKQYISIPSPEFKIKVEGTAAGTAGNPSAQAYTPKQKVEQTENDIRYVKTGDLQLTPLKDEFFSSWKHYLLLCVPLILFSAFLLIRKQQLKANSNVVALKERKAAKIAKKQLSLAGNYMKENKKDKFYNEVFRALNLYTSDKLNLPVAELTKENMERLLASKNVSTGTIQKLLTTLQQCEMAKYAPGALSENLQGVYNDTVELISSIEHELKA